MEDLGFRLGVVECCVTFRALLGGLCCQPVRRPRGVLDESEVKPPFFPPFRPQKTRATGSAA